MMNKILVLILVLIGSAYIANASSEMVFKPLPKETVTRMNKQRELVRSFVSNHFPDEKIYGDKKDFLLLQRIIDSKLINKNETLHLQSLGIILGDALLTYIEGLEWREVTDEYGTDPILRYKKTTLQLAPLTMISKRVEDNKEIDILHLANWLKDYVENKAQEFE